MNQPTRYRPPAQTSYAKRGWWARHLAEIGGAIAGFALGLLGTFLLTVAGVDGDWPGFLPLIGAVVGAVVLRWVARPRQAPPPPPAHQPPQGWR
jgi:hypothetical protein